MKALENYVEVHVRISQFWKDWPRGRIITYIDYPDENTVRCRAEVYRENTVDFGNVGDSVHPIADVGGLPPAATGHAEERRDQGMVNKTSAVENCETSAVGRALALMGYSIHKGVASREEVEIARRKADAQKNGSEAVSGPQELPERYVDWLRLAIRSYNNAELADEAAWAKLVDSAKSNQAKQQLVKSLEAALVHEGGDPEAVKERWQARKVAA